MRFKFPGKLLVFGVLAVVLLLLIINSRTPFFTSRVGAWSIGYGSSEHFTEQLDINQNPVFTAKMLQEYDPTSEFLADPFFVKESNKYYIFFERKRVNSNACLSVLTSDDGKSYSYMGDAIKEKFHLSYPQVFKHNDEFYMLPETQGSKQVLLYKSDDFPMKWAVSDTLLYNIMLKDPTVFLSDTLNIMVGSDEKDIMYMYTSDGLTGKWELHESPIVMMGTESRPGGRFIISGKDLILPVQNNSKGYGTALSLYRFKFRNGDYSVSLEKDRYLEGMENVPEFTFGMHHLDLQPVDDGYYFVYDGINIVDKPKGFNHRASLRKTYSDIRNLYYRWKN